MGDWLDSKLDLPSIIAVVHEVVDRVITDLVRARVFILGTPAGRNCFAGGVSYGVARSFAVHSLKCVQQAHPMAGLANRSTSTAVTSERSPL